jgi:hypothetical protein
MRPTRNLLRRGRPAPGRPVTATTTTATEREREHLLARKAELAERGRRLSDARTREGLDAQLEEAVKALRRDSTARPEPIANAIAVRFVGSDRCVNAHVPLPNLLVTLVAGDKELGRVRTDVTGLAIFPVPGREEAAGPLRLVAHAGGGAVVGQAPLERSPTGLVEIGHGEALEPHLAVGRRWMEAVAEVEKRQRDARGRIDERLVKVIAAGRSRLAPIERRLKLHFEKPR